MIWNPLRGVRELLQQQWFSAAELSELQQRRLQGLISHAYARVPYYRRLFHEHGLTPKDIATVEDLRKVPVLTKRTVRHGPLTEFLAEGIPLQQCLRRTTTGSTGHPLTILRTLPERMYGRLTYFRPNVANGVRPWHKQAFITSWDRPWEGPPKPEIWSDRVRRFRKAYIWAGQDVQEQIATLRACRPHMIEGFSQTLKLLAYTFQQSGITDVTPRMIIGLAELLDSSARALINKVFRAKMVDKYGAVEADCIAWECPEHCGYHLNTDTLIIEFIRDGRPAKPGESGHIVVTPLFLRAMPLIRYDLGDIGVPTGGQCQCGRGLPLMELIQGRADNFITLPSGAFVPPVGTFGEIIGAEPAVVEYRVVQEDYDLIVVELVLAGEAGAEVLERVKSRIEDLLRHEATVRVEAVDRIDRGVQPKFRAILSRVPVPF